MNNENLLNDVKCHEPPGRKNTYALKKETSGIFISCGVKQKEVSKLVRDAVTGIAQKGSEPLRVWCDGYLPIRRIVVGPSKEQGDYIEGIRHYCKNHYWMQDIDIAASSIPFRG
jgi:hypothetical protein